MSEKKTTYNIGITSIGSGVGQSAVNSCRFSDLPFRLIGMGANPMAFGAFDCDLSLQLPGIYHSEYIDRLLELCKLHQVQMLIPGLDDELLMIAAAKHRFDAIGCQTLVASAEILEYCRNKEKMSLELNAVADVFVKSYEKQTLLDAFAKGSVEFPLIAKPRSGFASRGIFILHSEKDFDKLSDDLVIQEIATPHPDDPNHDAYLNGLKDGKIVQVSEISIQYVVGKNGKLLGKCATYNKLNNGVPIEMIPYNDPLMWQQLDPLIDFFIANGLVGPINIQGRKTKRGYRYFEMNARFTGITGLRALMGFNEVEALIKDFLDIAPPTRLQLNEKRFGIRQVVDRMVQAGRYPQLDEHAHRHGYPNSFQARRNILFTGISGFLGNCIAKELSNNKMYNLFALTRENAPLHRDLIEAFPEITFCKRSDFEQGVIGFGQMDALIHCAFGRTKDGEKAIADGMELTAWLFSKAVKHQIPAIINMSTQAVYGLKQTPLWTEQHPAAPETPYAASKYASELLLHQLASQSKQTRFTSLRLSALIGPGYAMKTQEITGVFLQKALTGQSIRITGGGQKFDLLDVRDAAKAVIMLLEHPSSYKPYYNVGSGKQTNIVELAQEAFVATGIQQSNIELTENAELKMEFGMDISLISQDIGWKPQISLSQSLADMAQQISANVLK